MMYLTETDRDMTFLSKWHIPEIQMVQNHVGIFYSYLNYYRKPFNTDLILSWFLLGFYHIKRICVLYEFYWLT